MIRLFAVLGKNVVIIHNDTTVSPFEMKSEFSPLRGYYDGMFHYTTMRRMQLRATESIHRKDSKYYSFDGLSGITVSANGEIHTHALTSERLDDDTITCEQVMEFQGLINTIGDSWFGGDTYSVNAVSLLWEQNHKLTPELLFPLLDPTKSSSVSLTIATIPIDSLLKSIEMFNAGMFSDVEKLWCVEHYERPIETKFFGIDDVQEFNSANLAQITSYYNVVDDPK